MKKYSPENRNLFSDNYLETKGRDDLAQLAEDSRTAFEAIATLRRESRPERFSGGREQQLREEYLDKVLDALGWSRSGEGSIPGDGTPDYALFADPADKDAALSHVGELEFFHDAAALCEAKSWGANLSKPSADGRSPRGQIYGYLEDTRVKWGIVTNGREWMLVWQGYSRAQQRDYSVNLDSLLDAEAWSPEFGFFYGFFSRVGIAGGFADKALEQSRLSGELVSRSLKSNVYEALLTLGCAIYFEDPSRFRGAEDLEKLKTECLTFLYRLLFINYAESRALLPMRESDEYRRSFSLLRVKEAIQRAAPRMRQEEYQTIPTDRSEYLRMIRRLFLAIDTGLPMAQIPPYNGGLFRGSDHPFLETVEIGDRAVARVVDLLSRTEEDPERFVDYSYLGVRELGSIYEGLLEFNFRVADKELEAARGPGGTEIWLPLSKSARERGPRSRVHSGELYLVTQRGERKSTGSYYTPDEVVKFIVRQSLSKLVEVRVATARRDGEDPRVAILNMKILDPAMGSGHFLVAATEFLAERFLEINEPDRADLGDIDEELESWAKRQIASHCIYGVDLNPMAVELAKVSMWLTTFSRGQPLTFLDHRLRTGDSLIGSRLEEVAIFPKSEQARIREGTKGPKAKPFDITGLVDEFRTPILAIESIDESTVADVERKKELYLEFRRSSRFGRVVALADAHTSLRFLAESEGSFGPKEWDALVRAEASGGSADTVATASKRILERGHQLSEERRPFHWDLEFPEVLGRPGPGFDAVIGNPPYVRIYRGQLSPNDVAYYQRRFFAAHMKFDLYVLFLELGIGLLRRGGRLGFIVPDKFATAPYGEPVRENILRNRLVLVLDLRSTRVFPGVAVAPLILIIESGNPKANRTEILTPRTESMDLEALDRVATADQATFSNFPKSQIRIDASFSGLDLLAKLSLQSFPLSRAFYVNWGLRTGTEERTDRMITTEPRGASPKPLLRGEDVRERYLLERPPRFIDYNPSDLYNPMFPELFESPKVVFRKISGPQGIRAILDESGAYCFSTLICAVSKMAIKGVTRVGIAAPSREAKRFRDPAFVLAISNSRLVSWWYAQSHSDRLGVNPGHVQAIPMPKSLLEVTPLRRHVSPSSLSVRDLSNFSLGELEVEVADGGRRLQGLGDSIVREASSLADWIGRELGPEASALFSNKTVEKVEELSDESLVHLLEAVHRHQPLRRDPHSRSTQEAVINEFRSTRVRVADYRRQMATLYERVEKCVHLLFGLSDEESSTILRNPVSKELGATDSK